MSTKVRKKTDVRKTVRLKHRKSIRSKVSGTAERPRLAVFRSNTHLYAQVIDDVKGHTLASATTLDEDLKGKARCNLEGAKSLGELIAKRAQAKSINTVCFDRGGYVYHGKIKALADAAREAGLKF